MAIHKADGVDAYNNFPSKFIEVFCKIPNGESLSVGDVVVLDFTLTRSPLQTTDAYGLTVVRAGATANLPFACGVACTAVPLNSTGATIYVPIQVQYAGYNSTVRCELAAGIVLGDLVGTDNTNAGRVQAFTGNRSATADYFAFCVDAFTADTADGAIIIVDKGFFNG